MGTAGATFYIEDQDRVADEVTFTVRNVEPNDYEAFQWIMVYEE